MIGNREYYNAQLCEGSKKIIRILSLMDIKKCRTKQVEKGVELIFEMAIDGERQSVTSKTYSFMRMDFEVNGETLTIERLFAKFWNKEKVLNSGYLFESQADLIIKLNEHFRIHIEQKLLESEKEIFASQIKIRELKAKYETNEMKFEFEMQFGENEKLRLKHVCGKNRLSTKFALEQGTSVNLFSLLAENNEEIRNLSYPFSKALNKKNFLAYILQDLLIEQYEQTEEFKLKKAFGVSL